MCSVYFQEKQIKRVMIPSIEPYDLQSSDVEFAVPFFSVTHAELPL
jgi:hypothetical protein